jgi:hypothetical protein
MENFPFIKSGNEININDILSKIKRLTFEWKFNDIISLVNENFPNFFIKYERLLYLLMKLILIEKIIYGENKEESSEFYSEYFFPMLKKIYGNTIKCEYKNTLFKNLLTNSKLNDPYNDRNLSIKIQSFFERFLKNIEKYIRRESNPIFININFNNNKEKEDDNLSDIESELSNYRKEELKVRKNILFNVTIPNKEEIYNEKNKKENHEINKSEKLKEKPKNIRKINFTKKIVRKFKKYLKTRLDSIRYEFWVSFVKENYLPPFKLDNNIEYKSFSQSYLKWLFNHEGGIELYNDYIVQKGDFEIKRMLDFYSIKDEFQKEKMEKYFREFALIFSERKKFDREYIQEQIESAMGINKNLNVKRDELFSDLLNELKDDKIENEKYERRRGIINYDWFDKIIKSDSSSNSCSDLEMEDFKED